MSDEKGLFNYAEGNRAYLAIMKNGREYNIYADKFTGDGWILGRVAVSLTLTLFEPFERASGLTLALDRDDTVKEKYKDKNVYFQEPCVVRHSSQCLRVQAGEIAILEDSWRGFVDVKGGWDPRVEPKLDEEQLCKAFPDLARYRRAGGGFSTNPHVDVLPPIRPARKELPQASLPEAPVVRLAKPSLTVEAGGEEVEE